MKILIISYSYSPDITPRALRWSAIAENLVSRGYLVDVLCSGQVGESSAAISESLRVTHVKDWLINASARVRSGINNKHLAIKVNRKFSLLLLCRKMFRMVWKLFYWPDYACGWVIPAAIAVRRMCIKNDYDWIISVSHPFSGHLVGMVAKRCSPESKLFVDISDPYSDMSEPSPNNFFLYSKLNRLMEGRVMAIADIISVTTGSTRVIYESSFPVSRGKIHVIPPLLSLPDFERSGHNKADDTVRLIFVGTLYSVLRSPNFLLACIISLSRKCSDKSFELHFYGSINDCKDNFLTIPCVQNCKVFIHGLVSRSEVVQAMIGADILVNIGNHSESQLASKVVEYIAIGKPILNIVSILNDASIKVLADYPSTLTIFRSEVEPSDEIVNAIRDFIFNPPPIDEQAINQICAQFSKDHVAGIYASILEK